MTALLGDDPRIACPFCGEPNDLFLEPSRETDIQVFDEECVACGKAFKITAEYDPPRIVRLHAERDE